MAPGEARRLRRHDATRADRPPSLSGGLPLLGHSIEFLRGSVDLLFRAQRELGEIGAFRVFNRRMVALFGPDANAAVFRAPDSTLSPAEAYKLMTPVLGEGIAYDAPPERMAEQFRMLVPALRDNRMRTYVDAVVEETAALLASWADNGTVELPQFCRLLTSFTSSRCLIGREFREGMSDEFAAVYRDLERGVIPLAYINAHLPIPAFRRRDRARRQMLSMISSVIATRRTERLEQADFLQTLMQARYDDGRPLDDYEITGLLLAAMFAGHHTSAVTVAWTMLELLAHPDRLELITDEIHAATGNGDEISYDAVRALVHTENAVKETLRLHPPLFMLVRVARRDFSFRNWRIPKGTWVIVSPTVSHRMPEVFPEPDRFDPDRFVPPRSEDGRDHAFVPFGGGQHRCLGSAFALLQAKAILAVLFSRFEFSREATELTSDFSGLVVGPREPCPVRYHRRSSGGTFHA